jgi:glycosyltransferase involved in cell wall biosynthesis
MKVCITGVDIVPPWIEGVKNNAINLARALKNDGIDVFILTLARNFPSESYIDGIKVYSVKVAEFDKHKELYQNMAATPKFILVGRKILQRERPDVIHGNYPIINAGLIDWLIKNKNAKLVETMHGVFYDIAALSNISVKTFFTEQLPHFLFNNRLFAKLIARVFDCIIVPNNYTKCKLQKVTSASIEVIPNGVDTFEYTPDKNNKSFLADKIIDPNAPKILYLGHLTYAKGVNYLIQAFAGVLREFPRAHLIIAWSGGGTQNKSILKLIKNLKLEKNIVYLGVVDVPTVMASVDVFVLPRNYAFGTVVFPNTILESIACGTPVITTSVGGLEELINDELGILVLPRDVNALKLALINFFKKDQTQLKLNARKVAESYDWRLIAKKVKSVYERVCRQ